MPASWTASGPSRAGPSRVGAILAAIVGTGLMFRASVVGRSLPLRRTIVVASTMLAVPSFVALLLHRVPLAAGLASAPRGGPCSRHGRRPRTGWRASGSSSPVRAGASEAIQPSAAAQALRPEIHSTRSGRRSRSPRLRPSSRNHGAASSSRPCGPNRRSRSRRPSSGGVRAHAPIPTVAFTFAVGLALERCGSAPPPSGPRSWPTRPEHPDLRGRPWLDDPSQPSRIRGHGWAEAFSSGTLPPNRVRALGPLTSETGPRLAA
jgi:hypothetical protein